MMALAVRSEHDLLTSSNHSICSNADVLQEEDMCFIFLFAIVDTHGQTLLAVSAKSSVCQSLAENRLLLGLQHEHNLSGMAFNALTNSNCISEICGKSMVRPLYTN